MFPQANTYEPASSSADGRSGSVYNQLRFEDPPRPTSWGIKIQANAYQLDPRRPPLMVDGKERLFLFAVPLVCIWNGRIRALPCTVILVQDGPPLLSYKRLHCIYRDWNQCQDILNRDFLISNRRQDMRFYLQYDADFER